MKKNTLRLAILAIFYASRPVAAGEVAFDGSLPGGRAAGSLGATNGTFTINQSDGATRGANLFHSFGKFNIGAGETGLFTTSSADILNVIARVTGGTASTIDGKLQLRGFESSLPSLFFINPSGVTFGAGAEVNVPGAFIVSTANHITFDDGTVFPTDTRRETILTTAAVQSFGFLGDTIGSVVINNAATLTPVGNDESGLTTGGDAGVIAGDISIDASSGADVVGLFLASVASSGDLSLGPLRGSSAPISPDFASFTRLGNIRLSGGGITSVFPGGVFGGTVIFDDSALSSLVGPLRIEARDRLELNHSSVGSSNAALVALRSAGSVVIKNDSLVFNLTGGGDSQALRIDAKDISIEDSRFRLDSGPGVFLHAANTLEIARTTFATDDARAISLQGKHISLDGTMVNLRNTETPTLGGDPQQLSIGTAAADCGVASCTPTEEVSITNSQILTSTTENTVDQQRASFGGSDRTFLGRSADINIAGRNVVIDASTLEATSATRDVDCVGCDQFPSVPTELVGKSGSITVAARSTLRVSGDTTRIAASTTGVGNAGAVSLTAPSLVITGGTIESRSTVVAENAGKPLGTAGSVSLQADTLLLGQATISTDTSTSAASAPPAAINITSQSGNLALTGTRVTATSSSAAPAGSISIANRGGSISLLDGATVATTTASAGAAGNIAIQASEAVLVQSSARGISSVRSESTADTVDAGRAGSINIQGSSVTLDGGTVVASIDGGSAMTPTADVVLSAQQGVRVENQGQVQVDTSGGAVGGTITFVTPGAVTIAGTGTSVSSSSSGTGAAGSIQLGTQVQRIGSLTIADGALLQASTSAAGAGGSINGLVTGAAIVTGPSRISASTTGGGDAGGVRLNAARLEVSGATIESRSSSSAAEQVLGTAGSIALDADRLILGNATISTDTASSNDNAAAASITLSSRSELTLAGTQVTATTATGTAAGSITLSTTGGSISLQDNATVATTTNAIGAAGNVAIAASGSVAVRSGASVRSESTALSLDAGPAGTIDVTGGAIAVDGGKILASVNGGTASTATADVALTARTGNIDVRNQAQITVDTSGAAGGGNISFITPATVTLAGAGTTISSSSTGAGTAGSIQLGTATQRIGSLNVTNGAAVQANTGNTGNGGAINVFVAGDAALRGAGSTLASNATNAGDGGTITVDATNVQLADGARIQSTAMGSGDSGAITLAVTRDLRLTDSAPESFAAQTAILTSAQQSSGGNIMATVGGNLLLASSRIESSVATATGKGGDINLQTQGLLLSSSQIFARADQGNGGGITITRRDDLPPGPFLVDANSSISAQSRAAVSGVIAIDATDTNVTTVIDPLAASLAQTPALAANPCSSRQSGAPSTFVRDTDGGVSPLPDNYFTAGVLTARSPAPLAATSNEKITLAALAGAISPCVR